ncbi:unnamed protein product, partial [Mesorhabditis belari]|uniref:Uncharacterized protein n=1 Tax=Mesorhabditis belari TaxID=2138241 RepID=A0AAF3F6V8_9BILA
MPQKIEINLAGDMKYHFTSDGKDSTGCFLTLLGTVCAGFAAFALYKQFKKLFRFEETVGNEIRPETSPEPIAPFRSVAPPSEEMVEEPSSSNSDNFCRGNRQ